MQVIDPIEQRQIVMPNAVRYTQPLQVCSQHRLTLRDHLWQ